MENNLLVQLRKYYEEDPNDAFNIYALATECKKHDLKEALKLYVEVENKFPEYIPTYYHLAKLYESMDLRHLAITTYEKGIGMAKTHKQAHALKELQSAFNELMFE